jgi:hypothetical protein
MEKDVAVVAENGLLDRRAFLVGAAALAAKQQALRSRVYARPLRRERTLTPSLASPMPASWNQIIIWLRQVEALRQAA